jgi:STE24 endopeptidase
MMPLSLLIALVIGFGIDPPRSGVPSSDVGVRVLETCVGISMVAALAFGLGLWVAARVSQTGLATSRLRRRYAMGVRLLTGVALLVYGLIIHWVGWSQLVRNNWGLGGWILLDDLLIFLPYLLIQVLIWWGLYFGERALQIRSERAAEDRLGGYLIRRSRQSIGLILPVVLLYIIRRDILVRIWPQWEKSVLAVPLESVILGTLVLIASPLFVRLAWPTRPLEHGALRRRLERAADRVGFRFTDVLVWDTGHTMFNACVTGVLPGFRYVLLSDALIESMTPMEIAAVFGHEIGHIAHRHLLYFGFFFAGSLGVLALLAEGVAAGEAWISQSAWLLPFRSEGLSEAIQDVTLLGLLGLYFWLVFGHLSRRFERQADIFGSKVVSCDLPDCPPHIDPDSDLLPSPGRRGEPSLCPMGIRVFAEALANVAHWNGMESTRHSWRHGSIASRIAFLERLERNPSQERLFQRDIRRLRLTLGTVLALAVLVVAIRQLLG